MLGQESNRAGIYVDNEKGGQNDRHISHVALRTMRPDEMARFYIDVLEFSEQNAKAGDPNHYLTDGKMTLMIMPWRIKNYLGTSILPTGMDHIGFTVESVDKLKEDVDELAVVVGDIEMDALVLLFQQVYLVHDSRDDDG